MAHVFCLQSAWSFLKPGLSSCSLRCPRIYAGLTATPILMDAARHANRPISAAACVATSSTKGFFVEEGLPVFRCEPGHCHIRVGERHFARKGDHVLQAAHVSTGRVFRRVQAKLCKSARPAVCNPSLLTHTWSHRHTFSEPLIGRMSIAPDRRHRLPLRYSDGMTMAWSDSRPRMYRAHQHPCLAVHTDAHHHPCVDAKRRGALAAHAESSRKLE